MAGSTYETASPVLASTAVRSPVLASHHSRWPP